MALALVNFLTEEDLLKLRDDKTLLEATNKEAGEELLRREKLKEN
jgi:hypothetical protein